MLHLARFAWGYCENELDGFVLCTGWWATQPTQLLHTTTLLCTPAYVLTDLLVHILIHHTVGYSRYLLDTLRKRDSLGWLELAPQRWWHALHYADEFNYGGVEASVSAEMWEAAGAGSAGGAAAANEAGAEADEAEIGTPGGPKLR